MLWLLFALQCPRQVFLTQLQTVTYVSIYSTVENIEIISNEELNLWRYNYRVTHPHDPIENHNEGWCVLDQMDWNKKGQKKLSGPTIVQLCLFLQTLSKKMSSHCGYEL